MQPLKQITIIEQKAGTVWIASETEATNPARLHGETGKIYNVLPFKAWLDMTTAQTLAKFPLCEITAEFFDAQLNVLPPMHRSGALGFFCCEMLSGTITTQFVHRNGRYYAAYVDLSNRATWITPEKVAALPDAAPLEWFPA